MPDALGISALTTFLFCFRGKDSVKHFHVEHTGSSFKFGFNEFASLKELVMHFANQPLIGSETGKERRMFVSTCL